MAMRTRGWKSYLALVVLLQIDLFYLFKASRGPLPQGLADLALLLLPGTCDVVSAICVLRALGNQPKATDERWSTFLISMAGTHLLLLANLLGLSTTSATPHQGFRNLGFLLTMGAYSWLIPAYLRLGRNLTVLPEATDLKVRWPYSWSRHPMYLSYLVMVVGNILVAQTLNALVLKGLMVPFQAWRAVLEDRLLEATFGQEYTAYARRVGWFLGLGRKSAPGLDPERGALSPRLG